MHEAVPYWFKRWIFWRRDITLRPLVEMDQDIDPAVYMPQEKTKAELGHHEKIMDPVGAEHGRSMATTTPQTNL
jgi:hypothetical protein